MTENDIREFFWGGGERCDSAKVQIKEALLFGQPLDVKIVQMPIL